MPIYDVTYLFCGPKARMRWSESRLEDDLAEAAIDRDQNRVEALLERSANPFARSLVESAFHYASTRRDLEMMLRMVARPESTEEWTERYFASTGSFKRARRTAGQKS